MAELKSLICYLLDNAMATRLAAKWSTQVQRSTVAKNMSALISLGLEEDGRACESCSHRAVSWKNFAACPVPIWPPTSSRREILAKPGMHLPVDWARQEALSYPSYLRPSESYRVRRGPRSITRRALRTSDRLADWPNASDAHVINSRIKLH